MQEVDPFSDVKDGKQHAAQALGKLMAAQPGRFPPVLAQINAAAQPILQQYFQQPAENRSISSKNNLGKGSANDLHLQSQTNKKSSLDVYDQDVQRLTSLIPLLEVHMVDDKLIKGWE